MNEFENIGAECNVNNDDLLEDLRMEQQEQM